MVVTEAGVEGIEEIIGDTTETIEVNITETDPEMTGETTIEITEMGEVIGTEIIIEGVTIAMIDSNIT